MAQQHWTYYLRPRPGEDTPTAFRLAYAAVSGAALSLSYTGFFLSVYSWVCIAILLIVIFDARPRVAFACGFLHSFFFSLTALPWIATVLALHGGLSPIGGWAMLVLIGIVLGAITGVFAWCVQRLARRSVRLACLGAPFLWVASEFARAHLPEIGFPWNLLGYPASANLGLLQLTTVTGIYGLSFVVAAFNSLLAWTYSSAGRVLTRRFTIVAMAGALILLVVLVGPRLVPQTAANHYVRAVQVNFPEVQEYPADWFQTHTQELQEIQDLSLAPSPHQPDLLVWPEAPAPFSFEDPHFAQIASSTAIRFHHPFIAGVIEWKPLTESTHTIQAPYNSAILVDAQGQDVFTYDKVHLVPFGEYEPFPLIHRVVTSLSSEVGGFRKGNNYSVGHLPGGFTFGTFICYEAIFPGEVRHFAENGAELYVNISNDGWFGRSAAPEQHLRMARVRAVENRRWLVRVTNNGLTVSVDPYGRIFRQLPPDVRAAADLPYDFRTDETLYTRFGDWFAWLCVIVSAILVASTFRKGTIVREELFVPAEIPPSLVTSS
jgi:apolipoprotein N-acyltransferase